MIFLPNDIIAFGLLASLAALDHQPIELEELTDNGLPLGE